MRASAVNRHSFPYRFKKNLRDYWQVYVLLAPVVIYYLVFAYYPMYGVQIAFKDFMPRLGIEGSPWVGMKHFLRFFKSPYFSILIKNTFMISLYSLVIGFPLPIIFAIMLNYQRVKWFKQLVQTSSYAPHFISTVVLVGMMKLMLSPSSGVVNVILQSIGIEPIYFFGRPDLFYGLYAWSNLWKALGWSAIVYIGALSAISPELHEAATIDGASIWKRIRHIDLPGIAPTIVILLILHSGSLLSVGYEKAFLMQNNMNASTSEVISTYVYKQGLVSAQYSFSSAVGLFNSLINFVCIITVNFISRKVGETSLF